MSFLNFAITPLCVCYLSDCIKDVNRLFVDICSDLTVVVVVVQ